MAWQWKVEVDIESLRQNSDRLGKQINDLQKYTDELKNLIDTMRDFWEGDAAEAYIQLMDEKHRRALGVLTTLEKLKAAVDQQVNELGNVDNFFEKLWYQLFVN